MAANAAGDFEFLAATARRSIEDLRNAVRAVPTTPGRRGAHFLAVVEAVLGAVETRVVDLEAEFNQASDEAEQRAVVREMRRSNYDVMGLHEVTPWVEAAQHPSLAPGLVYFVDQMVSALLKAGADVVTTPNTTYMYSTIHKPYEAALAAAKVPYPAVAPVIVAYPVQEPDSLFLHLIIAHELGHSAVTEHRLVEEVFNRDPDPDATRAALEAAVIAFVNAEGGTPAVARAKVRAILRSWLTEIICDCLGLAFLGPSFLFTSTAFSTPFGGPEPSETHPPFTLRTTLLLERAESWNWKDMLSADTPETFRWIQEAAARPQLAGRSTYYLRLEEAIRNLSLALEDVVASHLGSERFTPEDHAPVAAQLLTLLQHDILPAQLLDRSPAGCRSIVTAGWIHAFTVHGDNAASLAAIVGDRELQRFLSKVLEMSVVLERWRDL